MLYLTYDCNTNNSIISGRKVRWVDHVARMAGMTETKDIYSILVGELEEYIFKRIRKAKLKWI
jgi:hypothetical protein